MSVQLVTDTGEFSCIGHEEDLCSQTTAVEFWSGQAAYVKYVCLELVGDYCT
jgi:hypothetical protein